MAKKIDVYQMVTDRIIDALENGVVPWNKPWITVQGSAPMNLRGTPYRGINTILLGMSPYQSQVWMTFKQAKAAGGTVRKGEKGTIIVFWSIIEKKVSGVDKKEKLFFLRYYTVFKLDQTDGVKLPKKFEAQAGDAINEIDPIEEAEQVIKGWDDCPMIKEAGSSAAYSPTLDCIAMPLKKGFKDATGWYATLFHEMGHATGHQSRLARKELVEHNQFGSEPYGKEELVAEMTSAFLCASTGIVDSTINNSVAYIQNWIDAIKGDKKLVVTAAGAAQKAADLILGRPKNGEAEEA